MAFYEEFNDSEVGKVYVMLQSMCKDNTFAQYLVKSIADKNFKKTNKEYGNMEIERNQSLRKAVLEILEEYKKAL